MADKKETKTILLPEGRVINASLFEKDQYAPEKGSPGVPSYKIELAFDPKLVTGQGTVEDELINAACDEWGDPAEDDFLNGVIRSPLLKGDDLAKDREERGKAGDAYKGMIVIRANTFFNLNHQDAPGGIQVYGPDVKEIGPATQNEIYPGCYGQAAVVISAYLMDRKRGVKFYLTAFQKTRDGDKLVSQANYSTLFKPVAGAGSPTADAPAGRRSRRS